MAKKDVRAAICADLVEQLERNGAPGGHVRDLAQDYMALWDIKTKLIADIQARGPVVDYVSNNGTINKRRNESVGELLKTNAQMLKLLESLGLKPSQWEQDGLDDEM